MAGHLLRLTSLGQVRPSLAAAPLRARWVAISPSGRIASPGAPRQRARGTGQIVVAQPNRPQTPEAAAAPGMIAPTVEVPSLSGLPPRTANVPPADVARTPAPLDEAGEVAGRDRRSHAGHDRPRTERSAAQADVARPSMTPAGPVIPGVMPAPEPDPELQIRPAAQAVTVEDSGEIVVPIAPRHIRNADDTAAPSIWPEKMPLRAETPLDAGNDGAGDGRGDASPRRALDEGDVAPDHIPADQPHLVAPAGQVTPPSNPSPVVPAADLVIEQLEIQIVGPPPESMTERGATRRETGAWNTEVRNFLGAR